MPQQIPFVLYQDIWRIVDTNKFKPTVVSKDYERQGSTESFSEQPTPPSIPISYPTLSSNTEANRDVRHGNSVVRDAIP